MKNKIFFKLSSAFSLCLVALAGIAVSTSTALLGTKWNVLKNCLKSSFKKPPELSFPEV